jgi:hypothetical protein
MRRCPLHEPDELVAQLAAPGRIITFGECCGESFEKPPAGFAC